MKFLQTLISLIVIAAVMPACDSLDDDRVPYAPVRVTFTTEGMWDLYGVHGATSWNRYIKYEGIPYGFRYAALDETGYGGLLMVCDIMGDEQVYDLACPVEVPRISRISIPEGETTAKCPECGSTYEVFSNYGVPLSGPASRHGYGLKRYRIVYGGPGEYRVITR